jgi:N-acetylglucosaminyldiphosphoundecaprenol N-acetyl-beta-D-mannosaminyltransferase
MMTKKKILNIQVDDFTMREFLDRFDAGVLVTPNVDHLVLLQEDRKFWEAYQRAEFATVDSQILKWSMGFLGTPVKARLSGSDIFPAFCEHHRDDELVKIFLLGGKGGVAEQAAERINQRCGRRIVVGWLSPSMNFINDPQEIQRALSQVRESGANVLAVGLGAPKQELWIDAHRHLLPTVGRFMALGATLDFEAGVVRRAPPWMSRLGLEWLFRLVSEPSRLWRRYLVRDPQFLLLLLKQRLGSYRSPFGPMPGH